MHARKAHLLKKAQSSQDFDFVVPLIFTGGPVLSGRLVRCRTFYRSSRSTGSHRGSRTTKRNYTVLTSEVYINFTVDIRQKYINF